MYAKVTYRGVVPVIGFNEAFLITRPLIHENKTQKNTNLHHRLCRLSATGTNQSPSNDTN